jgi:pSer/pThr/pTyr-binding forkhead associated (FHA) protein
MLVVLEAVAGPIAGRKIEVRAGSIIRFGRTAKSDYAIGEDSYLSGQHFAVECDGTQCRVRDLGSSNGTFLNGGRITEKVVQEGDSLVAGGSTFTIRLDNSASASANSAAALTSRVNTAPTQTFTGARSAMEITRPIAAGGTKPDWPGFTRSQSQLLNLLYQGDDHVYALLDASRDSRIPAFVDASGEPYSALDVAGRVPAYVVSLPRHARLLDVLVKDGWNRGWGFYCTTPASLEEVCMHWRSYLFLRTVDGKTVTFRFWDPRVLRALAPVMPAGEATEFFGPMTRLIVESDKPEIAMELSTTPRGGRQQAVMLI